MQNGLLIVRYGREVATIVYRTGFDSEYLLNVKCEFFQDSQSFEHAIIKSNNSTLYAAASALAIIRFAM